jgi:uncharacterized membrane protein
MPIYLEKGKTNLKKKMEGEFMEIIGFGLILCGVIVSVIFGLIILIKAFQASIIWGLAYLFIPFAALIFIITHWDEAGRPFLFSLLSIPLVIAGQALIMSTASQASM